MERFVDVGEVMEQGRVCAMQAEVGGGMMVKKGKLGGGGKKNQREKGEFCFFPFREQGKTRCFSFVSLIFVSRFVAAFGLPLEMAPERSICQTVIGSYRHKIPFVVFAIVEEIFKRGESFVDAFRPLLLFSSLLLSLSRIVLSFSLTLFLLLSFFSSLLQECQPQGSSVSSATLLDASTSTRSLTSVPPSEDPST